MKSVGPCCKCGCEVWLPDALENAARHSVDIVFYCSYGHSLCFKEIKVIEPEIDKNMQKMGGNVVPLKGNSG